MFAATFIRQKDDYELYGDNNDILQEHNHDYGLWNSTDAENMDVTNSSDLKTDHIRFCKYWINSDGNFGYRCSWCQYGETATGEFETDRIKCE